MYKTIIKNTAIWLIIVGVFIYAFGIYKTGLTIIQQQQIEYAGGFTWTYYKIDVVQYLQNLEYSLTSIDQFGNFGVAQVQIPPTNLNDVVSALKTLLNWIMFGFNSIIQIISLLLLSPLKILLYPLNVIYAIFGLNTSSSEWINITTSIYNFHIPFLPYI